MGNEIEPGTMFFGGLVFGGLIVGLCYGISVDRSLWLNEAGLAEVLIGLATLIALIVGGIQASRSYWLNRSAALSTRFSDAAQLLDGGSASAHAGIALTSEIASENPKVYGMPAVRALIAFAQRAELENRKSVKFDDLNRGRITNAERLPISNYAGIEAFIAAAKLIVGFDLKATEYAEDLSAGKIVFADLFLSGYTVEKSKICDVFISWAVLYRVTFRNVTFRNVAIHAVFAGKVSFQECTFHEVEIIASDRNGNKLEPDSLYSPRIHNCTGIETVTINGQLAQDFITARDRDGTQWNSIVLN